MANRTTITRGGGSGGGGGDDTGDDRDLEELVEAAREGQEDTSTDTSLAPDRSSDPSPVVGPGLGGSDGSAGGGDSGGGGVDIGGDDLQSGTDPTPPSSGGGGGGTPLAPDDGGGSSDRVGGDGQPAGTDSPDITTEDVQEAQRRRQRARGEGPDTGIDITGDTAAQRISSTRRELSDATGLDPDAVTTRQGGAIVPTSEAVDILEDRRAAEQISEETGVGVLAEDVTVEDGEVAFTNPEVGEDVQEAQIVEEIQSSRGVDVSSEDVDIADGEVILSDDVESQLQTQQAAGAIGGTTEAQREQVELLGDLQTFRDLQRGRLMEAQQLEQQNQDEQIADIGASDIRVESETPFAGGDLEGEILSSDDTAIQATQAQPDDTVGAFEAQTRTPGDVGEDAIAFASELPDRIQEDSAAAFQTAQEEVVNPAADIIAGGVGDAADFAIPIQGTGEFVEENLESTLQGAGSIAAIPLALPGTAVTAGEVSVGAGRFTASAVEEEGVVEGLEESGEAAAGAGVAFAADTAEFTQQNPRFVLGSLVGSSAIMAAAPSSRFLIQPGEEVLGIGGSRAVGAVSPRASRVLFPNNEPLIMSEEGAIAAGKFAGGKIRSGARRVRSRVDDTSLGDIRDRATPETPFSADRILTPEGIETDVDLTSGTRLAEDIGTFRSRVAETFDAGPTRTRPFEVERTLSPEGVDTEINLPAGEQVQSAVQGVRSRVGEFLGEPIQAGRRELQRRTTPRPEMEDPLIDLSDEDAVFVQDFRAETEAETESDTADVFGEGAEGGSTVEVEQDAGDGQVEVLNQDVRQLSGAETETERTGVGQERVVDPTRVEAITEQPTQAAGEAVGLSEFAAEALDPTQDARADQPLTFDQPGELDVGAESAQEPTFELGHEFRQEFELGQEFEFESEAETEIETETESEFELFQEMETETETESELELEFEGETETEQEFELFDDDDTEFSFGGGFGFEDDVFSSGVASAEDVLGGGDSPDIF